MTMTHHTQTSAPNTAAATSVSPLEQSGSSKTKISKGKTLKTAIAKLIYDTENNRCQKLAYREAIEGLCQEAVNQITICCHRHSGQTLNALRELAAVTLDTIIVTEIEGVQTRQNYGGQSGNDVSRS